MKIATFVLSFLLVTSVATAAAHGPHPLLPDTPAHVCENLLLGAQHGKPTGTVFRSIFQTIMGLRYSFEMPGFDKVLEKGNEGILFLPNHAGPIDPMILLSAINLQTNARPVMTEDMLKGPIGPLVRQIVSRVNAFIVPSGGKKVAPLVQSLLNEINNAVQHGDNVVLYPAGTIQSSSREYLGNKSAVQKLLALNPNMRIVLVRERGFWGSSWTRGSESDDPAKKLATDEIILRGVLTGIVTLAGNGFVLVPKRPITLEFFEPTDFPRHGTRDQMNRYMEAFYNDPEHAEKRTFVRRFFWQFWKQMVQIAENEIDYSEGPVRGHAQVVDIKLPQINADVANQLIEASNEFANYPDMTVDQKVVDSVIREEFEITPSNKADTGK